jgi:hypothetical protein
MVHAMTVLGFGDSPQVLSSLDFLVRYQRFDDGGWRTPDEFPYRGRRDHCWGRHTCYWGVTKFLRALSVVDERYKTAEVRSAERRAVDFVLLHRLIWSSHDPSKPVTTNNTNPTRLTAPLTYYDDAVEVATILLALGVRSTEIDETVEYVLSKRKPGGRWAADNTPGPLDSPFALKGEESRWVTYRVLRMLRLAGRL